MKLRSLVIAVFVMAFGAVIAHAAPAQMFGVGGGLSLPTGDASKVTSTGFNFGGTYCYKLDPQFGLGADVYYHMLGEKDQGTIDGVDVKSSVNALYSSPVQPLHWGLARGVRRRVTVLEPGGYFFSSGQIRPFCRPPNTAWMYSILPSALYLKMWTSGRAWLKLMKPAVIPNSRSVTGKRRCVCVSTRSLGMQSPVGVVCSPPSHRLHETAALSGWPARLRSGRKDRSRPRTARRRELPHPAETGPVGRPPVWYGRK